MPSPRRTRAMTRAQEVYPHHGPPSHEYIKDFPLTQSQSYNAYSSQDVPHIYLVVLHISRPGTNFCPYTRTIRPCYASFKDAKRAAWLVFHQHFSPEELVGGLSLRNIGMKDFPEEGWMGEETASIQRNMKCGSVAVVRVIRAVVAQITTKADDRRGWKGVMYENSFGQVWKE